MDPDHLGISVRKCPRRRHSRPELRYGSDPTDPEWELRSPFLPSDRLLGIYGRALFHFLRVHKAIDDVVAGATEARSVTAALEQCIILHSTKGHAITRLRAMFSSLLCSKKLR